jgi:hypothetical protein
MTPMKARAPMADFMKPLLGGHQQKFGGATQRLKQGCKAGIVRFVSK